MIIDEEVYLAHFGVPGMKWGVRRNPQKAYQKAVYKEAKEFRKVDRAYGKGTQAPKRKARAALKEKKAADPEFAKAFKEAEAKASTREFQKEVAKWVGIAGAYVGARYLVENPEASAAMGRAMKKSAIVLATNAGKVHRRLGESQVDRVIRKNAYVPKSGPIVDVYSRVAGETINFAGALGR